MASSAVLRQIQTVLQVPASAYKQPSSPEETVILEINKQTDLSTRVSNYHKAVMGSVLARGLKAASPTRLLVEVPQNTADEWFSGSSWLKIVVKDEKAVWENVLAFREDGMSLRDAVQTAESV